MLERIQAWWENHQRNSTGSCPKPPIDPATRSPLNPGRIRIVAALLGAPHQKLTRKLAREQQWSLYFTDTWTDTMWTIDEFRAAIVLVDENDLGSDTKERLFLLRNEFRCFVVILADPKHRLFWSEFDAQPGFYLVNVPAQEAGLISTVEGAWGAWSHIWQNDDAQLRQ